MARAITGPELTLLRSDVQWSKLYLAIYQPNTIYTALLNGAPSSNDRVYEITFDGGTGTLANVKVGMTLYVGTSAGAYDLGMCVIRKTPGASTFYIGLTSEIAWADNCYLTVVDDFDLWAKHATIASTVLSMDVDVGYSDQHSAFSPVPILGSHAVAWLDAATVDVVFSASDSWVFGSTISAYAWTAPGSSASSGMSTATPTVTYNAVGCYSVYCTVTAANGKTTTGVRHVFVYDRTNNQPTTVFQLSQCIGDHDTGGWMFDMTMEAEASLSEIHDRALVVLFAEDWYGATNQSIGPVANRENIVCVGRIVGESIRWDRESGLVHFTVQGFQHWLNKIKAFPIEMAFVGAATDWAGMPALTVDRVLWHILYWHSTAIETMDFYKTGDTRYSADGKTIASTIWGQLGDIAFSKIFGVPGVDRFGRLIIEIDAQMVPLASRSTFPVVMTLTEADWVEAIDFSRVTVQECSLISLNSEEVNSAGSPVTRYSLSPGHVPKRYGEPEMIERVLAASQADSNTLAGLLLGWRNNQFPDVPVNFAMNNRMVDCFPRQYCALEIVAGDTPRAIAFDGQLLPRRVAFYFDAESGYFHSEVNFEAETFEQISQNGDIPDTDAINMEIPPIPDLPDLPDLPILLPGLPGESAGTSGPRKVLVHDPTAGLLYSANFEQTSPTWLQVNAGLTTTQYQTLNRVVICPNGAVYVGHVGKTVNDAFLARAPYIGGTFVIIEDQTSINTKMSATGQDGYLATFNFNPLVSESLVYVLGKIGVNCKCYIGSGATFTAGYTISNSDAWVVNISYGMGQWLATGQYWSSGPTGAYWVLNANVTALVTSGNLDSYLNLRHLRKSTSGDTLHYLGDSNTITLGANNCGTLTEDVGSGLLDMSSAEDVMAGDPTLTYLMGWAASSLRAKSSDGGASWSAMGGLPTLVGFYFCYVSGAGTASCWIAASSYLYYSANFGTSWVSKQGNLASISPLYVLDVVKVVQI
jgi:hypothetical protein